MISFDNNKMLRSSWQLKLSYSVLLNPFQMAITLTANDQYKHIVPEAKSTTYMYSRGQKTL
jgi:hypothetical protein